VGIAHSLSDLQVVGSNRENSYFSMDITRFTLSFIFNSTIAIPIRGLRLMSSSVPVVVLPAGQKAE